MSRFLYKRHEPQGTMTCDYVATMAYDHDYDHFTLKLNRQHSSESGQRHGQWSWSKSHETPCPVSKEIVV